MAYNGWLNGVPRRKGERLNRRFKIGKPEGGNQNFVKADVVGSYARHQWQDMKPWRSGKEILVKPAVDRKRGKRPEA